MAYNKSGARTSRGASNAREAAFLALQSWRRNGTWSDAALTRAVVKLNSSRECALAAQLTYGVIARMLTLDEYIRRASSIGLSRVEPAVRDALRLGVYQMLFLTKIPVSAAVNETVKLTKRFAGQRAVPYVNAVLRTVAGWGADLPEISELWLRTGHPEWLTGRIAEQEGRERAEAYFDFNNTVPPLCLNARPGCDLLKLLGDSGIDASTHPLLEDAVVIERQGAVEELPGYGEGMFLVADPAARMAVIAADPKPGEAVLDACAAPGGKTILMDWHARRSKNHEHESSGLSITAGELHSHRLHDLHETLAKYGMDGVNYIERSAARYTPELDGAFDLVLADVPCSGFGIIRKKPEIRYKTPGDADALPAIQFSILDNLAAYVKPGGRLVYVTCTVLRSENRDVVDRFLHKHDEFSLEPFSIPVGEATSGDFMIWPQEHHMDGFYMARLRKRGNP